MGRIASSAHVIDDVRSTGEARALPRSPSRRTRIHYYARQNEFVKGQTIRACRRTARPIEVTHRKRLCAARYGEDEESHRAPRIETSPNEVGPANSYDVAGTLEPEAERGRDGESGARP